MDDYRNIRDADLINGRGLFMAEGELVVRTLLETSRFEAKSVFLLQSRLESMYDTLESNASEAPIYVAGQNLMDEIVGFHIHRGVLSAGVRGPETNADALLDDIPRGPARVLVLETLANHDNVGGVFRNAAAFGTACVLLDARTCDPLYRKAIRVSMGATLRTPFARLNARDAIETLRRRGFRTVALTPSPDARNINEVAQLFQSERVALLLGAEGPGLTEQTLKAADERAFIPMAAGTDSLNVASCSAVALHAFRPA
jgi:tRNA G18 (ribose-2'-O)-methylase SpoU